MSFISLNFLIFVVSTCIVYFITPKKFRWIVLLIASYVFYILTDVFLIIFILITSVSVYLAARYLEKVNNKTKAFFETQTPEWLAENKKAYLKKSTNKKKLMLLAVLILNLGILAFFKYFNGPALALNSALTKYRFVGANNRVNILLPLGISFYSFQAIGYLIDVYYGKYKPEKNIAKFALFVSFFPQLVQGPISRYNQLAPQLLEGHEFDGQRVIDGTLLILFGIFKKLVIADISWIIFNNVMGNTAAFYGPEIAFAMIAYMISVYCDFSGGIDIARGVAQILGINLEENFRRPHFATSIGDYWRRWHITLGTWMKDYVFYPITFSKTFNKVNKKFKKTFSNNFGKIFPTCIVMFCVFLLVGIWHGTELKNVVSGLYNGFFISLGIYLSEPSKKWGIKHPKLTRKNPIIKLGAIFFTLFLIFWSKTIVAAPDVKTGFSWIGRMFSAQSSQSFKNFFSRADFEPRLLFILLFGCIVLFVIGLLQENGIKIRALIAKQHIALRWSIYLLFILSVVLLCRGKLGGAFIYEGF